MHRFELHGTNDNNKHKLNWIIEADETLVQQSLELSYDGKNFHSLAELNPTIRAYVNLANSNDVLYYRLNVKFDNNQQYLSNIVALPSANEKPSVKSSLVRNSVQINSPSVFTYTIVDFSGRSVGKGNLVQGMNSISTSGLGNGMYIIKYNNGMEQYAEKFMKQ